MTPPIPARVACNAGASANKRQATMERATEKIKTRQSDGKACRNFMPPRRRPGDHQISNVGASKY